MCHEAGQSAFLYTQCILILIISYLATFLGTNSLSVLMCRNAVNQSILKLFQKAEPLIHLLYDECQLLLQTMMRRFLKLEVIEGKAGEGLVEIDVELAPNLLVEIDIGTHTKNALKGVAAEKHKMILLGMKNFFMSSTKYLQSRSPLNNSFTKHC